MSQTVFWPDDVREEGLCYGWSTPTLCVAGVIHDETALDSLSDSFRVKVLGSCKFERGSPHPVLEFLSGEYTIIYYRRHTAASLRFYSLENVEPSGAAKARQSALATSLEHDYTRPHYSGGIDATVINQFNLAKTVDALVQPKSSRLELSKYLFDFMDAVLYIPKQVAPLVRIPAYLKDFSTTIQQLDVRAEQTQFLGHQVAPLRQSDLSSIHVFAARYTNFFNTVWLILNDITIGVAFGTFLCENNLVLARMLNSLIEIYLIDWIRWALHWLDSWPAGLKLNTELSWVYSHTFSDLVTIWGRVLQGAAPYLPVTLYVFGILSATGMTTAIALFSDLLALLTVHIYLGYLLSRALYARLLRTGGSLWNLFRGKRFNVLRNRTDTWAYDTDQLLFGTILFTLLAFLFPTVLAYYALFALMRLGTLLLNAGLETQLAFMNHFPLFALMLRAKDPWRLPGGIYFGVQYAPGPVLVVKNQPVPFSTIFVQYIRLWSRLAAHYNPLRLLWYVLRGKQLKSDSALRDVIL
ncbi:N-acetylglucosaminyl transferase component-domain-containing protein [Roridomyces roridus]|uniref:N-acetylglucosaminyl transferase component-domain-containing protein n=1 Tax=Roridomyces roridus TaxID=1738132 RepID=A0AAD7C7X9_9AGAR|nr:N-acetylglucosaminyl transferase component-domain-containing protein [Roridomyces roridus]